MHSITCLMLYSTEQENFWTNEFGNEYIHRNRSDQLLASNLHLFATIFKNIPAPVSAIEFGANVGMNLKALRLLFPSIHLRGIEINAKAAEILGTVIGKENVIHQSIIEYQPITTYEVSFTKGYSFT